MEEHLQRIEQVFIRLREASLKLTPKMCDMLQKEVTFLGHVVTANGVLPSPTNIEKLIKWPAPRSPKQVKQFVAMCSYFRRFIKDFAHKVKPMVPLTKKGQRFDWDSKCQASFESLKSALVSPEIMGYPLNDGDEFILDTDASYFAIGAVLLQVQDRRERVIAYASRAMNKTERNYCITEKELLAVRYFIEYFRQYLLGRRFQVRTDHQALVWLFSLREPRSKIARWIEILAQYDFSVLYRPGKQHGHSDALSRCETPRDCSCPEADMKPLKCDPCKKCIKRASDMVLDVKFNKPLLSSFTGQPELSSVSHAEEEVRALTCGDQVPSTSNSSKGDVYGGKWECGKSRLDMSKDQQEDPDIGPILSAKKEGIRPQWQEMLNKSPATRHYWLIWDMLQLREGILFRLFTPQNSTEKLVQYVVPRSMRTSVLTQVHDSLLSAHLGVKRTKSKTLQHFYWYALKEDVVAYVKGCATCAKHKKPVRTPKAPMGTIPVGGPWDVLALDYIGPLPLTPRGNKYILVLTDLFTKYVEVLPVPDQIAEACARLLLNNFIAR